MDNNLKIFNEIAKKLLQDEQDNPVSEFVSSHVRDHWIFMSHWRQKQQMN